MPRFVHFELNVPDPDKSEAFWTEVFGWKASRMEGPQDYRLLTTGEDSEPGINGAIAAARDGQPPTVNTVSVDSVDAWVDKVTAAGGQLAVPKMEIPNIGAVAYCTDPNGILFGLFESAEGAGGG